MYPEEFLGYSVDEQELHGREGWCAPIGLRQNYLIGNEYRARYIDEAGLLLNEYNILGNDLQAVFKASNIQSL